MPLYIRVFPNTELQIPKALNSSLSDIFLREPINYDETHPRARRDGNAGILPPSVLILHLSTDIVSHS